MDLMCCPAGPHQLSGPQHGTQRVHQLSSYANLYGPEEAGAPRLVRLQPLQHPRSHLHWANGAEGAAVFSEQLPKDSWSHQRDGEPDSHLSGGEQDRSGGLQLPAGPQQSQVGHRSGPFDVGHFSKTLLQERIYRCFVYLPHWSLFFMWQVPEPPGKPH